MSSSCRRSSDDEGSGSRASSPPRHNHNHSPTTHNLEGFLPSSSSSTSAQLLLLQPQQQAPSFVQLPPIELAPYRADDGAVYEPRLESYPDMPFDSELADSFPPPSQSSSSATTSSTSSASSTTTSSLAPLPSSSLSSLDDKILHFTTTLAAAAAASGDGKTKEANIDELQRKLHFYQVMLWYALLDLSPPPFLSFPPISTFDPAASRQQYTHRRSQSIDVEQILLCERRYLFIGVLYVACRGRALAIGSRPFWADHLSFSLVITTAAAANATTLQTTLFVISCSPASICYAFYLSQLRYASIRNL
jgi:hypothetical protein